MRLFFAGILYVFLFPALSYAQADGEQPKKTQTDANLTGHVQDARTKEHIPFVSVAIQGATIGTFTDATGHYFLKNLPEGEYTLVASSVGYGRSEQKIRVVRNRTQEVNFLLEPQAIDMDEVVVTATRNETNKRQASTVVNVASAKLFENTASCNLAQTMNFQPGLRVENDCSNCGSTQIRINGLEGQYSQILLDSRPIFSSLATVYGLEQLPVSMVERVEVIRGGGSALFGSNAIGGVVNIITKEPLRNLVSIANTTNILKGGRSDINTSFNGAFVTDDYRAGVYLFGMVKNRQWYDRNGDGFSDMPKISSETIGFRGYYKTSAYSKLTAEYHHIHEFRRGGNNFDLPPHEADIAEQLEHSIDGGGLRFDFSTPDYRHRLGLYTSGQGINRKSYFGTEQNRDAYGRTADLTLVAGGQYTYAFEKLFFMPSELTVGAEYNHNDLHDQIIRLNRDLKQSTNIIGGFFQNEWKSEKLSLLVGARIDKHNLVKNVVFSPRANVRYSPTENVGLRVSYSSGYRAPQAYNEDLHVDAVSGVLSIIRLDPDLKPEYSHSFSASVDLYRNFGQLQTNLLIEGFYTSLKDVFTLVRTDETDEQGNIIRERRNSSGAKIMGVNLEGRMGIPSVFDLQLGFTVQRSRYNKPFVWAEDSDLPAQRKMFRSPDTYGYFSASYDIVKDFKFSLFGNYTGTMLVQHTYDDEAKEKDTPSFFDMGARLSYVVRTSGNLSVEFSGGMKNIFDSYQKDLDYGPLKDAAYIYGPSLPRTVFFGVKMAL